MALNPTHTSSLGPHLYIPTAPALISQPQLLNFPSLEKRQPSLLSHLSPSLVGSLLYTLPDPPVLMAIKAFPRL